MIHVQEVDTVTRNHSNSVETGMLKIRYGGTWLRLLASGLWITYVEDRRTSDEKEVQRKMRTVKVRRGASRKKVVKNEEKNKRATSSAIGCDFSFL